MSVSMALNWLLIMALIGASIFWIIRAKKILIDKDFSFVALKGGEPPPNPAKWAPYSAVINILGALGGIGTVLGVFFFQLDLETWTMYGGITIWGKIIADFALARTAHPFTSGKKKR